MVLFQCIERTDWARAGLRKCGRARLALVHEGAAGTVGDRLALELDLDELRGRGSSMSSHCIAASQKKRIAITGVVWRPQGSDEYRASGSFWFILHKPLAVLSPARYARAPLKQWSLVAQVAVGQSPQPACHEYLWHHILVDMRTPDEVQSWNAKNGSQVFIKLVCNGIFHLSRQSAAEHPLHI